MPSLILTGHPCAGKTTFAKQLAAQALAHKSNLIQSTIIINEQSARPDKTIYECYANSTEEKLTRSALKSDFDKYVNDPTKLVILDSMNYIKGFRYELHCISKAAGQKHGVIWTLCKESVAKAWNEERAEERKNTDIDIDLNTSSNNNNEGDGEDYEGDKNYYYSTEMMNELICRYEPPDQRNRWDRPLYRVDIHSTLKDEILEKLGGILDDTGDAGGDGDGDNDQTGRAAEEALNRSVYNMHSLSDAIRDTSQAKAVTSHKMVKSFRRSAGSGFKRAGGRMSGGFKKKMEDGGLETSKDPTSTCSKTTATDMTNTTEEASNNENTSGTKPINTASTTAKREVKKMEDLIEPILDSFLLDVEPLKEGLSTRLHASAHSNVLHDVDSISQETLNSFLSAQKLMSSLGGGTGGKLSVKIGSGGETYSMQVNRLVKVAELKRLRRQYIKYVSAHPPQDTSEGGIAKSFLSYIENQI